MAPRALLPISVADGLLWARLGIDREYRLRARTAPGSYGTVFLAHTESAGDFAVKAIGVLHSQNVEPVYAAISDAAARARRVGDPAVLAPSACGRSETAVHYVAPWASGGNVADMLRQQEPGPLARVVALLRAVAPALDRAHEQGLVHGGITPGNLLFGDGGRVFVGDFGVGAALGALPVARNPDAARSQAYTAPEQWRGGVVDGRADQYALALIAYELLTARTRYDARGVEGVPTLEPLEITDHSPLRPDLPLHVNGALRTALSAKPANRYPTVAAFVDALEGKRASTTQGLPLVRFRIGDIKPRHVVFTLSGMLGILAIAALGDVATDGALRAEARQFYERFVPDAPHVSLSPRGDAPLSRGGQGGGGGLRVGVGGGGGAFGGSAGSTSLPSMRLPGGGGQAGAGGGRGAPSFGPEITGGSTALTTRGSAPSSSGSASGRRLGLSGGGGSSGSSPAPTTPASVSATSAAATGAVTTVATTSLPPRKSDDDVLPSLWARARQSASRLFGGGARGDSGATSATDAGVVSVDADGTAAVVTVDGVPRGTTPATLRLSPGQHTIAVHGARQFTPSEIVVNVTRGGTTSASFRLK